MNRRGQIFALYLVFLTLFMCGFSIFLHNVQQREMGNSLVSPFELLELENDLEYFNIRENDLILDILCNNKESEAVEFHEFIVAGVLNNFTMKEFLVKKVNKDWEGLSEVQKRKLIESFYRVSKNGKVVTIERKARKDFELLPVGDE